MALKNIWAGFCVAFSLYSVIPMPKTDWTKDTMKYALCFLPVVGIVVGVVQWLWLFAAKALQLTEILYSALAVLLPIIVTGGIHLDGFIDTSDALASHAGLEKRLEIMKDPHIGAFSVLYVAALLVLQLGLYGQFYTRGNGEILLLALGFVVARIVGGGAIVCLPCAKGSGLAHTFAEGSNRRTVKWVLLLEGLCCFAVLFTYQPVYSAVLCIILVVFLLLYRRFCIHGFGGITGDLAGSAITCMEVLQLILCVVWGLVVNQ